MDQLESKTSGNSAGTECNSTTIQSYSELTVEEDLPILDLNRYETLDESDFEEEKEDTFAVDAKERVNSNFSNDVKDSCLDKSMANSENSKTGFEKENSTACEMEGETSEHNEIEDGEITERTDSKDLDKYTCRFYQRGKCAWGRECRFLHISDKGLYSMLDVSAEHMKVFPPISFRSEMNYICHPPFPPEQIYESVWDRALNEAKERVRQSKINKKQCLKDRLYMTIHSDDKTLHRNSPQQRSPASKRSHDIDKPDATKRAKTYKAGYYSEWRDPWRRSKSPRKRKRSSETSKSSKSCCSRSSCRYYQSPMSKRLRQKSLSDSSSSSSSCSCEGSTSSCSDSSSDISRRKPVSRRTPSYSPTYSKTKDRLSSENIKKFRSISRSVPIQKPPNPVSKKKTIILVKGRNYRSKSSLSSRFCKTNYCNQSCSDMSISPLSDSSAICKSKYTNKSLRSETKPLPLEKLKSSQNKASSMQSRVRIPDKDFNTNYVSPAAIGKRLNNIKKANSLEMELWKYRGIAPIKESEQMVQPSPNLVPIGACKNATPAMSSENTTKSTIAKKQNHPPKSKPSKRDILMQQLKAVEEAIARKKTSFHLIS